MTEIKVYHSIWRTAPLILGCLAFGLLGFLLLNDADASSKRLFIGWATVILFGGAGLIILGSTIYTVVRHIPFLKIYDDRLEMYVLSKGRYEIIRFADVEQFRMSNIYSNKMIAIDYLPGALRQKMENSSGFKRGLLNFNFNVAGTTEAIPCSGLTMKGKELCDLLNERVAAAHMELGAVN